MEMLEIIIGATFALLALIGLIITAIILIKCEYKERKEIRKYIETLPIEEQQTIYKYKGRYNR